MKNLLTSTLVWLLASGCATSDSPLQTAENSSLLDDDSCDIIYFMVKSCHEIGIEESNADSCDLFAAQVRQVFDESLAMEIQYLDWTNDYCAKQCRKGISGAPVPETSEVCL